MTEQDRQTYIADQIRADMILDAKNRIDKRANEAADHPLVRLPIYVGMAIGEADRLRRMAMAGEI